MAHLALVSAASSSVHMNQTEQSFAAVLEDLTSAAGRDAGIRVATQAAIDLAAIDGLCLCARAPQTSIVSLAAGPRIYACETLETSLPRLVETATGEPRPMGMSVVVPLSGSSDYRSVGFFWQPGYRP